MTPVMVGIGERDPVDKPTNFCVQVDAAKVDPNATMPEATGTDRSGGGI